MSTHPSSYELSHFDEAGLRVFAAEVARRASRPGLEEYEMRQEAYEEPYFFGLLNRTKTRSVRYVVRKYWTLGRIYYHNEFAHEAHGSSSYSYTTENELVLMADGSLAVSQTSNEHGNSLGSASTDNLLALDFEERSRSNRQTVGRMIEEWTEITRSGPARVNAKGDGLSMALESLL